MRNKSKESNPSQETSEALASIGEGEVVSTPTIGVRDEVDMQVATARRWPRSIDDFRKEVLRVATECDETARSCTYSVPRAGKFITGPSVRFLEIVASAWGNLREEKRTLPVGPNDVVAIGQATAWDMQRNRLVRAEVTRRITGKDGKRYSEDMIATTANAAASIAHRNALKACIPQGFWQHLWQQVQAVGEGKGKTLEDRRKVALQYFKKQGVDQERICRALGVAGVADIGPDELATLQGLWTSIKEGDTTAEEAFPVKEQDDAYLAELKGETPPVGEMEVGK